MASSTIHSNQPSHELPICVLCLDGGGVRGLASLLVLRILMERLQVKTGSASPVRPSDHFDLIIGTGTGGISALFLGRMRLTVDEAIESYVEMAGTAFQPCAMSATDGHQGVVLDGDIFDSAFSRIVETRLGAHDAPLAGESTQCHTAVLAATSVSVDAPPYIFRSYTTNLPASAFTIGQVARATISTAGLFEPVSLGYPPVNFIDVAVSGYNNPAMVGLSEAASIWPNRTNCLVSLGTGRQRIITLDGGWDTVGVACRALVQSCERVHDHVFDTRQRDDLPYFRFNIDWGLDTVDVMEWGQAGPEGSMAGITEAYMHLAHVQHQLDICTRVLNGEQLGRTTQGKVMVDLREKLRPAIQAQYNSTDRSFASLCLEGTREDLLASIYDWGKDMSSEPIFWLSGLVGTGKSTIAQTVSMRWDSEGILGASFFFARGRAGRDQLSEVFPTLAYQLSRFKPAIGHAVSDSLNKHPDARGESLQDQLRKLIVEPIGSTSPNRDFPVMIVLDALDECEAQGEALLRLLDNVFPQLSFRLKIFVTSRPEQPIRTMFRSPHLQPISLRVKLHELGAPVVKRDIERFVRHGLAQIPKRLGIEWSGPSEDETAALVQRAGALFIYAATIVNFIGDVTWPGPEGHLRTLLSINSRSPALGNIDELYMNVLQSAVPKERKAQFTEQFRNIVGAIVLLREPFSVASLVQLLPDCAVPPTLAALHALLVVPTNDARSRYVQTIHPSFPDFLLDPVRCTDQHFYINSETTHGRLAIRCLDLLISRLKRNICAYEDFSRLNSELEDLQTRIRDHIPFEVQYACVHWAYHLSRASSLHPGLLEKLRLFSETKLLYWLEVLSLIRSLDTAPHSFNLVNSWGGMDIPLSQLVHDARRFVLEFFDPIGSSAGHTYSSALPFTPDCRLRTLYAFELSGCVRVVTVQAQSWTSCERVIEGRSSFVEFVAFSPDGARIVSGSRDCALRLWDSTTGTRLAKLKGHSSWVICVAFSPDGSRIVSGSYDRTLRIWDSTMGTHLAILKGHSHRVTSAAFSPDGARIVSGSWDCTLRVWDSTTGTHLATFEDSHPVKCVTFSPDGTRIVSGSSDATLRIWDSTTGTHLATLEGHSREVNSVVFSPDGARIVSGSSDSNLRVWDSITGTRLATLIGHSGYISSVAFSPDNTRIVSGSSDCTLRLWDSMTGTHLATLKGHSYSITSVAFSPDNASIVSGSEDCTLRVWNSQTGTPWSVAPPANTFTFSPDGSRIVSESYDDDMLRIWDSMNGTSLATLQGHSRQNHIAFSLDGSRIFSWSTRQGDGSLLAWNSTTFRKIFMPSMSRARDTGTVTRSYFTATFQKYELNGAL